LAPALEKGGIEMFDKLIESNSAEAEFKPRRKFFMMSSVVVGILFLSAVVFSLYAQDIDLGTDQFELSTLVMPIPPDAPEPEQPRPQPQQKTAEQTSELPSRQKLIAHIDRPHSDPPPISTTPSKFEAMPIGKFVYNPDAPDSNGRGSATGPATGTSGTGSAGPDIAASEPERVEPPPVVVKAEAKPPLVKSEGVINGKATYLPSPQYPPPAKLVGAAGIVNVQVTIDESGKVISSKAVSGHALLRQTAESAAWKARFSPTYLSRVPVKVTGVIVFNFKKGY
jgi:TonB family protein